MTGLFLSADFRKGRITFRGRGKPYKKKLTTISGVAVWLVEGRYVRKRISEDFVNYDHHYRLGFIPINEFWISDDSERKEIRYYIDRMLMERRLIQSGVPYRIASDRAAAFEKSERMKSLLIRNLAAMSQKDEKVLRKVRRKVLRSYSGKVKVWVVDGMLVRSLFLTDFGGGGHDLVYTFIPGNEVWIDSDISPRERKFIVLHELHERNLMSRGMSYEDAHRSATSVEDFFRHRPKATFRTIKREIKKQRT